MSTNIATSIYKNTYNFIPLASYTSTNPLMRDDLLFYLWVRFLKFLIYYTWLKKVKAKFWPVFIDRPQLFLPVYNYVLLKIYITKSNSIVVCKSLNFGAQIPCLHQLISPYVKKINYFTKFKCFKRANIFLILLFKPCI